MADQLILENRFLKIAFDEGAGSVVSVYNKSRQLDLISSREEAKETSPWRLDLQERGRIEEIERFGYALLDEDDGPRARLSWITYHDVSLTADVWLPKDSRDVYFKAGVSNGGEETVLGLEYPIIAGIGKLAQTPPDDFLAAPFATGFLFKNPFSIFKTGWSSDQNLLTYPNNASMQFLAYYKSEVGGFYMASHDPSHTRKRFQFFKRNGRFLEFSITHQSWDVSSSNSLKLDYPILIGVLLEGNWYEAAEKYRSWAERQEWCSLGSLSKRVGTSASKWLLEEVGLCTFGVSASFDMSPWLSAYHKTVQQPIFHILGYDWTRDKIGLLNDLFPARIHPNNLKAIKNNKDYFALFEFPFFLDRSISEWKDASHFEVVMLEDTRALDNSGYLVCGGLLNVLGANKRVSREKLKKAERIVADSIPIRLKDVEHVVESIRELVGNDCPTCRTGELAYMCPLTEYWRNFLEEKEIILTRDYDSDAIYHDIGVTQLPLACYSSGHGHPKGSGRWFIKKARETLMNIKKATREAKGKYVPLGTELISEVFIPCIDFYQARAEAGPCGIFENADFRKWIEEGSCRDIPLFAYVYHDYGPVRLDGWGKISIEFGDIFYWIASRVTLNGGIFELNYEYSATEVFQGMETNPVYTFAYGLSDKTTGTNVFRDETHRFNADRDKIEFLGEISEARTGYGKDFLVYGRMTRPARFDNPTTVLDWYLYNQPLPRSLEKRGKLVVPAVVHTAWKHGEEKIGYFFVNVSDKTLSVTLDLMPERHLGTADDRSIEIRYISSKRNEVLPSKAARNLRIDLEPRRIALIQVRKQRT